MLNIKNLINNITSTFYSKKDLKNQKNKYEIIYSKLIDITNCNTEGRQRVIKRLIKLNNLDLNDDIQNELLDCSSEIDECDFLSNTKHLKVIVLLDDDYIYDLGYIPNELEGELYQALDKSDIYNTELYVTKKDNLYDLQLEIVFKKIKED